MQVCLRIKIKKRKLMIYLIDKMKKQLHLSKKDFARLIEYPLKYDEYVKILKEANVDL